MRNWLNSCALGCCLLLIIGCSPKGAAEILSKQERLNERAKVVFLDVNQNLPSSTTKIGNLVYKKMDFSSSEVFYNLVIATKIKARKAGANLIKATSLTVTDSAKNHSELVMELHKYDGDLAALEQFNVEIKELPSDSVYRYIYLDECSLITSKTSRRWCSELSIQTAILSNYGWPTITDSATFENREIYELKLVLSEKGKIMKKDLAGGSNATINRAILAALDRANISFIQDQNKQAKGPLLIAVKMRSYNFIAANLEGTAAHPQAPVEVTDNQLLKSMRNVNFK